MIREAVRFKEDEIPAWMADCIWKRTRDGLALVKCVNNLIAIFEKSPACAGKITESGGTRGNGVVFHDPPWGIPAQYSWRDGFPTTRIRAWLIENYGIDASGNDIQDALHVVTQNNRKP